MNSGLTFEIAHIFEGGACIGPKFDVKYIKKTFIYQKDC
jgi:hypothetical protein